MICRRDILAIVWLTVGLVVSGCVGTDVGNPEDDAPEDEETEAEIRFEGLEQTPMVGALTLPGGFHLEQAWLAVGATGMRRSCEEEAEGPSGSPVVVDLLSENRETRTVVSGLRSGTYCGVDLHLEPLDEGGRPADVPSELVGHSVLLVGERADGVTVRLEASLEESIGLVAENSGFDVDSERRQYLVVVALERWIDRGALKAVPKEDTIIIDAERNTEAFESFRQALDETVHLYRDRDGNGRLEPAEQANRLASNRLAIERDDRSENGADTGTNNRPDVGGE